MFIISVENLKIAAFIGVYDIEKIQANTFSIDIFVETDFPQAMYSDKVEDALDYAVIYEIVVTQMQVPCNLLEKKIGDIANALFSRFEQARNIRIKIKKNAPLNMPLCDNSAVEFESNRAQFFLLLGNISPKI